MREIFSVRFFAAVGAVVGLLFLLTTIFATRDAIDGGGDQQDSTVVEVHKIDLVEQVFSSSEAGFRIGFDGTAAVDTNLIIDGFRSVRIVAGTPGEMICPDFGQIGACAVVADLLGEAVVWFALVPMGPNRTVPMPAIDTLDDDLATLVNGWQVTYAPVLDRRCPNEEFVSYREFREVMGDDFTAIFDLDQRRIAVVECRTRVSYAPEPVVTAPDDSTTSSTTTSTVDTADAVADS